MLRFAVDGITSFSTTPLKVATCLGLCVAISAFGMARHTVGKTLLFGDTAKGYPSLMTFVLMLVGVQFIFLGLLGEYLGRLLNEAKRRPVYLVADYVPSSIQAQPEEHPLSSPGDMAGSAPSDWHITKT